LRKKLFGFNPESGLKEKEKQKEKRVKKREGKKACAFFISLCLLPPSHHEECRDQDDDHRQDDAIGRELRIAGAAAATRTGQAFYPALASGHTIVDVVSDAVVGLLC
jgi:hypothetical protein